MCMVAPCVLQGLFLFLQWHGGFDVRLLATGSTGRGGVGFYMVVLI